MWYTPSFSLGGTLHFRLLCVSPLVVGMSPSFGTSPFFCYRDSKCRNNYFRFQIILSLPPIHQHRVTSAFFGEERAEGPTTYRTLSRSCRHSSRRCALTCYHWSLSTPLGASVSAIGGQWLNTHDKAGPKHTCDYAQMCRCAGILTSGSRKKTEKSVVH